MIHSITAYCNLFTGTDNCVVNLLYATFRIYLPVYNVPFIKSVYMTVRTQYSIKGELKLKSLETQASQILCIELWVKLFKLPECICLSIVRVSICCSLLFLCTVCLRNKSFTFLERFYDCFSIWNAKLETWFLILKSIKPSGELNFKLRLSTYILWQYCK